MKLATGRTGGGAGLTSGSVPGGFDFSHWSSLPRVPSKSADRGSPPQNVGVLERAVALAGIIVLSPLMLLIILAIKIDSPGGPVLYSQERVGLNRRRGRATAVGSNGTRDRRHTPAYGQPFMVYKFRTMIPDAEKHSGPVWAQVHDPRITRIGRVLRKLRLDEIPQLFNVVRGDMRLIGPRPERPHFVAQLCEQIPEYAERLRVPPGITGLAQVERDYDASVEDVKRKVMYDLFYVRHWNRLLDTKILITTVDVVLRGRGAR